MLRNVAVGSVISLVILASVACSLDPPHYICEWNAERYIKRDLLTNPASFDQHQLDTTQVGLELGKVTGSKEDGWVVESIILFGTQNAFGVKSDFFFHYTASVDEDDNCGPIIPLEFGPYTR